MQKKEPTLQPAQRTSSSRKRASQSARPSQPPQTPPLPQPPASKTPGEWRAHWKAQGQPWRTEPEIGVQRQEELAKRRAITPDVEKGIYPFSGMNLNRADIEWLLATHENGRGPIKWNDESQRERQGLDLRGADLRGSNDQPTDLTSLPLTHLVGGLNVDEWIRATERQLELARVMLEGVHLSEAHLEGAELLRAHLERARLSAAHLEGADLSRAHLEGAALTDVILGDKDQIGPRLVDVQWDSVNLAVIDWSQVMLLGDEQEARQKHDIVGVQKRKGWRLSEHKAAVRANRQLSVVLQSQGLNEDAARFAYRAQLLQRAAFGFQMIQDGISLRQRLRAMWGWLFSWFLFLLAGYGYKPLRSFLAYLLVIAGFATAYYLLGLNDLVGPHHVPGPHYLSWYEAFVVSMTAFHGRGFFVGTFSPGDPQALVAAIEAFLGLLIEVTFIATLTQRLFSR